MRKQVLAVAFIALGTAAHAASFTSFVTGAPAAGTLTGAEGLGVVQGGVTRRLSIATLVGYVQANLPIISLLGYTPCSTTGCTMTGPLVAPLQAAGATTALDLGTREQQLGYLVTDFGAKCDGTTDDTALIQTAMNAAASLQVDLTIAPRGMTCRASALNFLSNARLHVYGTLKTFGNTTTPLTNLYSSTQSGTPESNVVIDGDGVIDNQMTARGVAHPTACIYTYGAVQNLTIRGVTLQGCGNSPVNIVGGSNTPGAGAAHVYLSYLKILGTGNNNANQFANGCDDCWADHLRIDNLSNDFLWAFYGNVTNSGITHSYINAHGNPGTMGIGVLSDAGQPAPSANLLIEGNEITGVADCAVWVQGTSTATSGQTLKQKNIRIIGNDGHGNNTSNTGNYGGECVLDGSGVTSIGNSWHDDGAGSGTSAGIYLYPSTSSTQASDNFKSVGDTISNEGAGGGVGLGVVISTGVVKPAFYEDSFYDTQSTPTMSQAFNGACNADCTIIGSKIDAAVTSPFGGLTISGSATIALNGAGMGNYIAGDLVLPGNQTTGGIGIFNGGLRAVLPTACTGQPTGTLYKNGTTVSVCP